MRYSMLVENNDLSDQLFWLSLHISEVLSDIYKSEKLDNIFTVRRLKLEDKLPKLSVRNFLSKRNKLLYNVGLSWVIVKIIYEQHSNTYGSFNGVDIKLNLALINFNDIAEIQDTLIHELRHAVDSFLSKNKVFNNYPSGNDSHAIYLKHQSEISARIEQALLYIGNEFENIDKKGVLNVINAAAEKYQLTSSYIGNLQNKKFIKRAANYIRSIYSAIKNSDENNYIDDSKYEEKHKKSFEEIQLRIRKLIDLSINVNNQTVLTLVKQIAHSFDLTPPYISSEQYKRYLFNASRYATQMYKIISQGIG